MRLTQSLNRAVQMRGDQPALFDGDAAFTWTELVDRIARLAAGFLDLGMRPGDRVVLLDLNTHRSFETYFAALWAGGVIASLNHRLSPAEIAAQFVDVDPAILVAGGDFAAVAADLVTACPRVRLIGDATAYEALIANREPAEEVLGEPGDLACLFYTGGTTGGAKGVMLSHGNIVANSMNFIGHMGLDHTTTHLHCGPLFHVAAGVRLFSVSQLAGAHVILPRFEADEVLRTIERRRVTLATFVPTMLRSLLDHPELESFDLSSLAYVTYGAAPMPRALLRELMERLPHVRFVQSYGMTETSPIATMLGWREHADPSGALLASAGRPALLAEVRVVDPQDRAVPTGERGEVVVRGPMVMQGYWNKPEATAQAIRDGWMHTGDVGYLDAEGYLFVVDRLKDMIITGGENVYSQEVENVIIEHPAVREAAVFGLPDAKWGERVHAVVGLKSGASATPDEIIAHCKARIAGFKCPKAVTIRTEPMPLSGANKILKTALRAEMLTKGG